MAAWVRANRPDGPDPILCRVHQIHWPDLAAFAVIGSARFTKLIGMNDKGLARARPY
jgi:hypothetical protein